jgi:PAS domain S-box-containing protein
MALRPNNLEKNELPIPTAIPELLANLYEYQNELKDQNAQLLRTQADLEAERARYFDLYEFAPVGYATLDDQGAIQEMNLRAAELFGISRDGFNGRKFNRCIVAEDQDVYCLYRKRLLESGLPQVCEVRVYQRNGPLFWARLEMVQGQKAEGPHCRVVVVDISDRKIAESKFQENESRLQRSLSAKSTLIQEVHHRVKNNLQVISSLLRMQAELVKDQTAAVALNETYMRILSMSLIHERLCADGQLDLVDFGEYTEALLHELFHSHTGSSDRIVSCLKVSRVVLNADQAIPCGLILNELVTNALKYAYPNNGRGEIVVELSESELGYVTLGVSDQGIGLPEGLDWKNSNSLGLPIVDILARQIGGELFVGPKPGASFTVEFPKSELSAAASA